MSHQIIRQSPIVQAQLRHDIPSFKVGALVEVVYKIIEGTKERTQTFKGIVTNRHNLTDTNATFTVMKNSTFNTKVERTFPVNSPLIVSVTVTNNQRARRSNLRGQLEVKDPKNIRARKVLELKVKTEVAAVVDNKPKNLVDSKAKTPKSGDDLTIIEGIGPKAAEVLINNGINTFALLASTPADTIKEFLNSAEAKVQHLDPTSWAQQSQLAADGKFDELETLKGELNNGKEVAAEAN
jgi:ribosomal protein L19